MKQNWKLWDRYDDIRQRTGKAPICQAASYARAVKRDGMMEFILSTSGVKRDGFDLVQTGWRLDQFGENPVALWRHSDLARTDIMGTWPKVWVSRAGGLAPHLRGSLKWATEDENEEIRYYRALYENEVLRATSVRWEDNGPSTIQHIKPDDLTGENVDGWAAMMGGIRFLEPVLIEGSLVPLGADKNALSARCRSNELPQAMLDRFVANQPTERTEDGREILLLDGHPASFEVERDVIVDLGKAARAALLAEEALSAVDVSHVSTDADAVDTNGFSYVIEPVEDAERVASAQVAFESITHLMRATQRYLRGEEADEAHLTAEFGRFNQPTPWGGPVAQSYRALYRSYLDATGDEGHALRPMIEELGRKLFGDARLREPWEPRALPEPKSMWAPVSSLLEDGLRAVVADGEERDAHVDSLIAKLDTVLGTPLRQHSVMAHGLKALTERVGIKTEGRDFETVMGELMARVRKPDAPTQVTEQRTEESIEAQSDAEVDPTLALIHAKLDQVLRKTRSGEATAPSKGRPSLMDSLQASRPGATRA